MSRVEIKASVRRAYAQMAALGHRPLASPNAAHMAAAGRLAGEATAYADEFAAEDNAGTFRLGCSDEATARAMVFAIEAMRAMNDGEDTIAATLLQAAAAELDRVRKKRAAQAA